MNSSTVSPAASWLNQVNRIEYVLSGGLQLGALMLLSLPLCGHFCRRQWLALKGGGMAGSLLLYQLAQVGFLLPSLLYNCYMLWAWLGLGAQFSVTAMFWLGVWPQAANLVVSNAMCFLALDRCFILLWPTSYVKLPPQRWLSVVNVLSGLLIFVAGVTQTILLELPLNVEKASYCGNYPCVLIKYHSKYSTLIYTAQELINLTVSLTFFALIRRKGFGGEKGGKQQQKKKKSAETQRNRIMLATILLEMLFKVVPGLLCTLINNLTTIVISNYLGWYILLFASMDSFAISLYFALVLLKSPKALFSCFGLLQPRNRVEASCDTVVVVIAGSTFQPSAVLEMRMGRLTGNSEATSINNTSRRTATELSASMPRINS